MLDEKQIPAPLLIFIALVQGLVLLLLHQSIELTFWPYADPAWLFCFYSIAFTAPIMLLLGLTQGTLRAFSKWVVPFTLLVGALGFYVGSQATPLAQIKFETLLFALVVTLAIAVFKALMYTQQLISGDAFSYSNLFRWSWRNFLTLALAMLFALCVWGVLMLWAGLFKAIKINFFWDLFTETWFFYPTLATAHGFGVLMFRRLSHVIDTITRLQQALMKFLLVLLVLVSILFLGGLLITGLQPLWESGGSHLILWMQALMLFFVNAVYQDDAAERPYHRWVHRFIFVGVALLPLYSAISFYGLMLRIDQYGWSLARCWGMLIWLLLALFSVGYLWGIVRYRDNWLKQLSRVNVALGLAVLGLMLAVNSPLLDFRKITVASQLQRLDSGQVSPDDFDVRYFRYDLARPGYEALEAIKQKYADSNPELVLRIDQLYSGRQPAESALTQAKLLAAIKTTSGEIPAALGEQLFKDLQDSDWAAQHVIKYYLLPVDANADGQTEYLYVQVLATYSRAALYFYADDKWQSQRFDTLYDQKNYQNMIESLENSEIKLLEPKWKDIELGGYRLRASE
jgi:hypothetical protein